MAELSGQSEWLAVIGKSLAYLCLSKRSQQVRHGVEEGRVSGGAWTPA